MYVIKEYVLTKLHSSLERMRKTAQRQKKFQTLNQQADIKYISILNKSKKLIILNIFSSARLGLAHDPTRAF